MNNGLQICAIATKMARKAKAVRQEKEADTSTSFLDASQSYKMDWMVVQRANIDTMEPKTTRKAL